MGCLASYVNILSHRGGFYIYRLIPINIFKKKKKNIIKNIYICLEVYK